jgi:hypothetical protein
MKHEEIKDAVIQAESLVRGSDAVATLAAAILLADATHAFTNATLKIDADARACEAEKKLTANELRKQWTR